MKSLLMKGRTKLKQKPTIRQRPNDIFFFRPINTQHENPICHNSVKINAAFRCIFSLFVLSYFYHSIFFLRLVSFFFIYFSLLLDKNKYCCFSSSHLTRKKNSWMGRKQEWNWLRSMWFYFWPERKYWFRVRLQNVSLVRSFIILISRISEKRKRKKSVEMTTEEHAISVSFVPCL